MTDTEPFGESFVSAVDSLMLVKYVRRISTLEARIRELEADKARLDWIESNVFFPSPPYGSDNGKPFLWQINRIPGDKDNPFQIQRQLREFHQCPETLREAIDAAREEK